MRRSLTHIGRAAAIGVMLLSSGAGSAVAAVCAKPPEREALDARVLQTELIVAALSCGESKRYKAFVGRFENELIKRAAVMKKFFARSHGGRANKELNQFVTSLANEASQRSLAEAGKFCTNASQLFEEVLKVQPKDLVQFASARPSASSHGVPLCGEAKKATSTKTASNKPQPSPKGSGS